MAETILSTPDLGNVANAEVIAVLIKPGDTLSVDDAIITLESDKASMDVPATAAGTVLEVLVKVGDKINKGSPLVKISATTPTVTEKTPAPTATATVAEKAPALTAVTEMASATTATPSRSIAINTPAAPTVSAPSNNTIHAGPAVRRLARELGIDLARVPASGPKQRILLQDVQGFVKSVMASGTSNTLATAPMPFVDFSQYGMTSLQPLSKIKRLTGQNVHRSWVTVPHVTQFDEADITELEAFRQDSKKSAEKSGAKLTMLVFLMKAVVACLRALPLFNSSLDAAGNQLVLKHYYHIGVAVDTPDGLVVPVIRDVDQKGLIDLALELAEVSDKARNKKLLPAHMQGSCFTISSLGGIGGTAFTPIVNAPDVAILGVSKAQIKPCFINDKFEPRLMLPLSLSYDHRVIDGADGARFTSLLANYLADVRKLLL